MPYVIQPASDRPPPSCTLTPKAFDEETQTDLIFQRPIKIARVTAAPTTLTLHTKILLPGFSPGFYQTWVVTAEAKRAIELYEPNVHSFFPLEVWQKKKMLGTAYLLYISTQIDSIILEKSKGSLTDFPPVDGKTGPIFNPDLVIFKTTLNADRIKGLHLWRGDRQDRMVCFVSDELQASLSAAGVQGIQYFKCDLA